MVSTREGFDVPMAFGLKEVIRGRRREPSDFVRYDPLSGWY